ncbi:hypothetical protein KKA15_00105 [Patescibacteria group bacterium]|nr:hypothetical protein [Patescibacteria group bacterium]
MLFFSNKKEKLKFDKNYNIIKINEDNFFADSNLLKNFFNCYRDVFSHAGSNEWGEYKKCNVCSKVYSIEDIYGKNKYEFILDIEHNYKEKIHKCDCGGNLLYYYSDKVLMEKMKLYFTKDSLSFFLLTSNKENKIVGFIIGYIDTVQNVINEKLKPVFGNFLNLENFNENINRIVYVDELGIAIPYRVGKLPLFSLLTSFILDVNHNIIDNGINLKKIWFWTSTNSKLYSLINRYKTEVVLRSKNYDHKVVISVRFKYILFKLLIFKLIYL